MQGKEQRQLDSATAEECTVLIARDEAKQRPEERYESHGRWAQQARQALTFQQRVGAGRGGGGQALAKAIHLQ